MMQGSDVHEKQGWLLEEGLPAVVATWSMQGSRAHEKQGWLEDLPATCSRQGGGAQLNFDV